jgi:hypothetical protein
MLLSTFGGALIGGLVICAFNPFVAPDFTEREAYQYGPACFALPALLLGWITTKYEWLTTWTGPEFGVSLVDIPMSSYPIVNAACEGIVAFGMFAAICGAVSGALFWPNLVSNSMGLLDDRPALWITRLVGVGWIVAWAVAAVERWSMLHGVIDYVFSLVP